MLTDARAERGDHASVHTIFAYPPEKKFKQIRKNLGPPFAAPSVAQPYRSAERASSKPGTRAPSRKLASSILPSEQSASGEPGLSRPCATVAPNSVGVGALRSDSGSRRGARI